MKKSLLILGAGGHGKVVLDVAKCLGTYETIHFLDDGKAVGEGVLEHPVIGTLADYTLHREYYTDAIVALGNNATRLRLTQALQEIGYQLPTLIHPKSTVSQYAQVGAGTVIMPQAVVNADAHIGEACIINTGAIVEHDCKVGAGSHIAYRAVLGGAAKVGQQVLVDIGAIIQRGAEIGDQEKVI